MSDGVGDSNSKPSQRLPGGRRSQNFRLFLVLLEETENLGGFYWRKLANFGLIGKLEFWDFVNGHLKFWGILLKNLPSYGAETSKLSGRILVTVGAWSYYLVQLLAPWSGIIYLVRPLRRNWKSFPTGKGGQPFWRGPWTPLPSPWHHRWKLKTAMQWTVRRKSVRQLEDARRNDIYETITALELYKIGGWKHRESDFHLRPQQWQEMEHRRARS